MLPCITHFSSHCTSLPALVSRLVFPHLDFFAPVSRYLSPPSIVSCPSISMPKIPVFCTTSGRILWHAIQHALCPPSLPTLTTCLYAHGHKHAQTHSQTQIDRQKWMILQKLNKRLKQFQNLFSFTKCCTDSVFANLSRLYTI